MLPASVKDQRRWVRPEALNVSPALAGLPLATPARRMLAMGLDLAFIALLSDVSGFWLVCSLGLTLLLLRLKRQGGSRRVLLGWALAVFLGLLALQDAWDNFGPQGHAQRAEKAAQKTADEADETAEAVAEAQALLAGKGIHVVLPASAAGSGAAAVSDAQRIAQLEAEIAELKKPKPFKWRQQLRRLLESAGVSFGWGMVYFSLLPAFWNGQTLGKKALRLQVLELTDKPLTVMRCLRRYGGYAAGMATGGLGFLQVLWDVNRQGIQDRVAHTVVVDLRAASKSIQTAPEAPAMSIKETA
jgi:uncharacterized RDD family membrane protein YckC